MHTEKRTACNKKVDRDKYKKVGTVCKHCYKRKERNKNIFVPEKQNNDKNARVSANENHCHVFIGSSNLGKTYYNLKIPGKLGNKLPTHIKTRSSKYYSNFRTTTESKPINFSKESVMIFDDVLVIQNSSYLEEFFTRGRHEILDVCYNY